MSVPSTPSRTAGAGGCAELAAKGITTLYLLTDHTGFYERYGWEFFCTVRQEGEPQPIRVYRHRAAPAGKQE